MTGLTKVRINKDRFGIKIVLKFYFLNFRWDINILDDLKAAGLEQYFRIDGYEKCLYREIPLEENLYQVINLNLGLLEGFMIS